MLSLLASLTLAFPLPQDPPKPPVAEKTGKPEVWTGVLDEAGFAALHELAKGASPKLEGKDIRIGATKAYLSLPKKGKPTAAVLVIHEWWGLNDHVKHWADRLAADGYAALAIDLYGGKVATTRDEALAAMRSVEEAKALAVLRRAHTFLATDPRIHAQKRACIGWCFGGGWSLKLAMAAPDLDAAVVYYGHLVSDSKRLATIRAPVLGIFGNRDKGIPPKSVDAFAAAMKTAGRPVEIHRYPADHAFANPSSARYDTENAAAAWREVRQFLREKLAADAKKPAVKGKAEFQFDVPKSWRTVENKSTMRVASLAAGKACDVSVTVLGGDGGGVAANLTRWRRQMGQPPLSDAAVSALPKIPILGRKGCYARIDGSYQDHEEAVMLVSICTLDGRTLFVKMTGPKTKMADQEANFKAFCASLR